MVEKIRELCKRDGISINKLEIKCGLGRGTVSRWDKNVPSADKVVKVANYFNVPVSELTGDGQKEKPATEGGFDLDEFLIHMDGLTYDQILQVLAKAAEALQNKSRPEKGGE